MLQGCGNVINWVIVEDAAGNQLGPGDIRAREVSVTPKLDAAGKWSATCIGSDRRALDLLQVNRVVRIYRQTHGNPTREIGAGIITTRQFVEDPGKHTLRVDGPDLLEELRRKNTLLGREYAQDTLNTVVQALVGLVPGWTATVEAAIQGTLVEARFDGTNILKALVELAHRYDCHLRLGGTPGQRMVEISRLGNATLHTFRNAPTVAGGDFGGDGVVLRVTEDKITTTGDNYYNVLMPVGAGEGEAALTLATTTRSTPYPIQSLTGPDLRTLYYLATTTYPSGGNTDFRTDAAAIVKVAQMRDIGPLSQSTADIRNAADALYDEAAEKLKRAAIIQEVYNVTLTGVAAQIRAGDRARILYHSDTPGNTDAPYLSVDGTFIVLEATETVNVDHAVVSLKVSNIDRQPVGAIEILLQAIQKLELHSLKPNIVQGAPTAYVYDREIAPGLNAEVPIEFTDSTLELNRCRLRLKTSPLRTTAVDALDIPAHRHRVGFVPSAITFSNPVNTQFFIATGNNFGDVVENNASAFITGAFITPGHNNWVTGATEPNITSQIAFDIHDDSDVPGNITVYLQNTDITQQLFGSTVLAPDVQAMPPPLLLADFSFIAGATGTAFDAAGTLLDASTGSVIPGGDSSVEVPFPAGNTAVLEIERVVWDTSGPELFHIGRINPGPDFDDQDDNFGQESVYLWLERTQELFEFDFSSKRPGAE